MFLEKNETIFRGKANDIAKNDIAKNSKNEFFISL